MGLMKQVLIKANFEKKRAEKILKSNKSGAYEKKIIINSYKDENK